MFFFNQNHSVTGLLLLALIGISILVLTNPVQQGMQRNLAMLAWSHGDAERARVLLENLHDDTSLHHWHLYRIYAQLDDQSTAAKELALSGYDWQSLVNIGDIYFWAAQDWAKAQLWYQRARDNHENSTILFKLGQAYEIDGKPLLATDVYSKAVQLNIFETNEVAISNPLVRLATLYQANFDKQETSLVLATQALELDLFGTRSEDKAQAYYLQGAIGANQGRDPSFCIGKFQHALEIYPSHFWANLLLGREYYREGRPLDVAVGQIKYAISLQPKNKWGYLILADIYVKAGKENEAKASYQEVLKLAPEDVTAKQFLQQ